MCWLIQFRLISLGIPPEELWGRNTGVFVGLTTSDAHESWGSNPEDPKGYAAWGCCKNMFANRISYNFNFRGKPLTINAPIPTKVICFSLLLKCFKKPQWQKCGPRSVCSGSTLFASILNSSVMLGNYLSAFDIFRCIFFLAL